MSEHVVQQKEQGKIIVPSSNEQRQHLLNDSKPAIIFVTDGMMESPLSRWYYDGLSQQKGHSVILTGHVGSDTFGHELLVRSAQVRNEVFPVVHHITYKIHQNIEDVKWMMGQVPSYHTVLVHADQHKTNEAVSHLDADTPFEKHDHHFKGKLHLLLAGDHLEF